MRAGRRRLPCDPERAGCREAARSRAGMNGLRDSAGLRIDPDERPPGFVRDPDPSVPTAIEAGLAPTWTDPLT